jgi:hypothetical protein
LKDVLMPTSSTVGSVVAPHETSEEERKRQLELEEARKVEEEAKRRFAEMVQSRKDHLIQQRYTL